MNKQRGGSTLLFTVLMVSVVLLAWSILSTWHQGPTRASSPSATAVANAGDKLPPPLESKGAKASLFYPVLKARGPQPGSNLVSKPLIPVNREALP